MIRVLRDDLAFIAVDAVIRPTNEILDPVTPQGSRLDERAGPRFHSQRQLRNPLDVGAAVVTGAGQLEAQFVVHVVIQSAEIAPDRETVRRALVSAWHRAAEWDLARVATPLVGTGAGGLSLEEATALLTETFRQHVTEGRKPEELTIVLESESEREQVQAIVMRGLV